MRQAQHNSCPGSTGLILEPLHDAGVGVSLVKVSAGRLDQELLSVTKRVTQMLQMLPKDITPVNLEELRRVKQNLVELESKADTLRQASWLPASCWTSLEAATG